MNIFSYLLSSYITIIILYIYIYIYIYIYHFRIYIKLIYLEELNFAIYPANSNSLTIAT